MEKAMYYEHIVRRANGNGGRYCVAGADADIFSVLWNMTGVGTLMGIMFRQNPKGGYGIVVAFVRDSIKRLIKTGGYSKKAVKELEDCYDNLLNPTIEVVENVIDRIADVLHFSDSK